ncbi:hypothetical protein RIF29_39803 [Crotalaria pallida]|uniref:F-box domain-containing protein n=1 Tax=Crotalaria pallida TaxID=3830 RepID=A0AAN9E2D9_CROPI
MSSGPDRISSMPDEVLCHILSFLPMENVVATSVLSKRWLPLRHSVSVIDLNDHNLVSDDATYYQVELAEENASSFQLPSLVTLELDSVTISKGSSLVELLVGCPNLEELEAVHVRPELDERLEKNSLKVFLVCL